jgi:hypothetical protein
MTISVDGQAYSCPDSIESLHDVVFDILNNPSFEDRQITEVLIDGNVLAIEDEEDLRIPFQEDWDIVITTTDKPMPSFSGILQESLAFIGQFKPALSQVADGLRCSPGEDEFAQFSEGMNSLKMLVELLDILGQEPINGMDFSDLVNEQASKFLELMGEVKEAIEGNDQVLLADLVEYEILEWLDHLSDLLQKALQALEA